MKRISKLACDSPDAINRLYMRYVQPNEVVFRKNYLENCCIWSTVEFESCTLDFVPVVDGEYLIIDKEIRKILGTFTPSPFEENKCGEETISSILIADEWDVRKVLPAILEKKWSYVYFVFNQEVNKFASFFKIKKFLSIFPANIKFFGTTEEMRQYFLEDHDAYLPKRIVALEPEKYQKIFEDIHDARIQSGVPSNNEFLSICIPTYNRGKLALKSIKTALTSDYDAEIEFIVCDNGSTEGAQEYKEIENMKDSRLRYYRSPQNRGYQNNILNCLQKAKGKFVLFISDEDSIIPENIGTALNWLSNHREGVGACIFSGSGTEEWAVHKEKVFEPGPDAVIRAYYMNYVTGCCFNLDSIKERDLFRSAKEIENNFYYRIYTHCALGVILALQFKVVDSNIVLWHFGEERAQSDDWGREGVIRKSETPESRSLQSVDAVKLVKGQLSEKDLLEIFSNRMNTYYDLLSLYYKLPEYSDDFKKMYSWINICTLHYKNYYQLIEELGVKDILPFVEKMNRTAFNWLVCKRRQKLCTPEENLLSSLQAQVAKYHFDKGTPFGQIDFEGIEKDLCGCVKEFLEKRS